MANLRDQIIFDPDGTASEQYAPSVVSPAGTPRYTHGPVIDPTPIIPVPNTGA